MLLYVQKQDGRHGACCGAASMHTANSEKFSAGDE
jgi:hypothetical protein